MKIQTMGYLLKLKNKHLQQYYNYVCVAWQEMIAPE